MNQFINNKKITSLSEAYKHTRTPRKISISHLGKVGNNYQIEYYVNEENLFSLCEYSEMNEESYEVTALRYMSSRCRGLGNLCNIFRFTVSGFTSSNLSRIRKYPSVFKKGYMKDKISRGVY